MRYGPMPPKKLPEQDSQKVTLHAERWARATWAHSKWAEPAKEAIRFLEGDQYTEAQKAEFKRQRRAPVRFNIIAPVVRLVLGFHRNNRSDITFQPGQDLLSSQQTADALTAIEKTIATGSHMEYVDAEVFLEGIAGGRGWFDTRLNWDDNILGEIKTTSLDPFAVKVDPDADTYDVNESASFMMYDKFVSIDEIEASLGAQVAELVRPLARGLTPSPISSMMVGDDVTAVRTFGRREDMDTDYWDNLYSLFGDLADRHRKTVRIVETQFKVREMRNVMFDLETGDSKVLPHEWGPDKIQKALLYAETVGNPCVVHQRSVERLHWTTLVGDVIVHDAPSLYDKYTMSGYFPYFRRGVTRGMVDDLIDAQKEKNKRRLAEIEVVSKTANGGWKFHETSMDPVQEANLKRYGSRPGVNIKWKGEHEPQQIAPAAPPMAHERLENKADEDIRRISGINEAALGDFDNKASSGKAIEARQRQATISVQLYMDNFKRSKELVGEQHIGIIQNHYSEERVYRITGDDGAADQTVINQMVTDPASGAKRIINDVSLGKYAVVIDDAPLSATFAAGQFEEMMTLLEKLAPALGPNIGLFADLIVGQSSMPKKEQWIARLQQLNAPQPQPGLPAPGGPGGGQPVPQEGPPQAQPGNVVQLPVRA
jgi:hypothetical protein